MARAAAAPPTEAPGPKVQMQTVPMQLATGRPAVLAVPSDVTWRELMSVVNGVSQLAEKFHEARQQKSPIAPVSILPRALRRRG